jgi:hypothetical protein
MHSVKGDYAIPREGRGKLSPGSAILVIGMSALMMFSAGRAQAQTQTSAALMVPAPPAVIGNVWNGMDHQPTAASDPPLDTTIEETIDHTLDALDRQLLQLKLPKLAS